MGWQEDQKAVATGVTSPSMNCMCTRNESCSACNPNAYTSRNDVLEEVAKEFDRMTVFGDTAASFAVFVRGMKR